MDNLVVAVDNPLVLVGILAEEVDNQVAAKEGNYFLQEADNRTLEAGP